VKRVRLILYWSVVAIPLAYGVWMTLQKSLELVDPPSAAATADARQAPDHPG